MLATTIDIGMPPAWHSATIKIQAESKVESFYPKESTALRFAYSVNNAVTTNPYYFHRNNLASPGWTDTEALETHLRLKTFADDWDYPGMEAYDEL